MAGSFTIGIDDREVKKKLSSLAQSVKDFSEPLAKSGDEMLGIYGQKVFDSQGIPGAPWRSLAATTLHMRAERIGYYSFPPVQEGKTLVWTGRLRAGFYKAVQTLRMEITNDVEYFKYHQNDRPMLYINPQIIDIVHRNLTSYIKKFI